ncbi:MAG: hypothetical protein IPM21_03605 [Acidobacteria bacterium]|nr:hypothetical protein [Acidobacteriota bacterium]
MLKTRTIFVFFLFLVCPGFGQTGPSPSEYAVYGAVLRTIYAERSQTYSNESGFVIIDQTFRSEPASFPTARKFKGLVDRFKLLNRSQYRIERKLPPGRYSRAYDLVSQGELDRLFLEGRAENERRIEDAKKKNLLTVIDTCGSTHWQPFYRKFPEAGGYYQLSRVAIGNGFALVRVKGEFACSGFDSTYLLQRTKRDWSTVWSSGTFWVA